MEAAVTRFAFRLIVLLGCAIAALHGEEQTPSREVVELVSIIYKPARLEAKADGESENAQTAAPAPAPATNANSVASPKPLLQGRAPLVVQHANSVRRPVATRSARTSVPVPGVVKASCRPSACRAAVPASNAVIKRTGAPQGRKAEPPLPAVFVPVRTLGLYLQARMGAPRDGKAAPGKRKR